MNTKQNKSISLPDDELRQIARIANSSGLTLHCTGGFRAHQVGDDKWMIEPILEDRKVFAKGFLSQIELQSLLKNAGIKAIAFESINWINGCYNSNWMPIIPNQTKHLIGPADLWSNIAGNLAPANTANKLRTIKTYNTDEVSEILDETTKQQKLARYISYSLCSIDMCVQQIAEFYNEQTVDILSNGHISSKYLGGTFRDKTLFTHVHSFFLHLGTARDYLGAFLAEELGMDSEKIDDMTRLIAKLSNQSFETSPILRHLKDKGNLAPKEKSQGKWDSAGWLKSVSEIRNQFVHKRPYGSYYTESIGQLIAVDQSLGIFKYFRPLILSNGEKSDLLDEIDTHYKNCVQLFYDAAKLSGLDSSMWKLPDKDIVSIHIEEK